MPEYLPRARRRLRRAMQWIFGVGVALAPGCARDETSARANACAETPDANRAIVLAFYRDGLEKRDPKSAFPRYMSPDFVEHKPDVATGTRDSTAAFLERLMQEMPAAAWQVHRTVAEGDLVFLHASFTPAPAAPAYAIADLFRLQKCKIVEHWDAVAPPTDHPLNPHSRF